MFTNNEGCDSLCRIKTVHLQPYFFSYSIFETVIKFCKSLHIPIGETLSGAQDRLVAVNCI